LYLDTSKSEERKQKILVLKSKRKSLRS